MLKERGIPREKCARIQDSLLSPRMRRSVARIGGLFGRAICSPSVFSDVFSHRYSRYRIRDTENRSRRVCSLPVIVKDVRSLYLYCQISARCRRAPRNPPDPDPSACPWWRWWQNLSSTPRRSADRTIASWWERNPSRWNSRSRNESVADWHKNNVVVVVSS